MTPPTLYLHIGLPKTATTYLQDHVFPALTHLRYVGTPSTSSFRDDQRAASHPRRLLSQCVERSAHLWRDLGDEVFDQLVGGRASWEAAPLSVLASDEGIGRSGSRASLLRRHLEEMSEVADRWGFGAVKVICMFRRQDHWMASHYAQLSDRNRRASQADFVAMVEKLIDPYVARYRLGSLLDYKALRDELVPAVGTGGLLMLPHEQLRAEPEAFHDVLFHFLGAAPHEARSLSTQAASNVRSSGDEEWRLRVARLPPALTHRLPSRASAVVSRVAAPLLRRTSDTIVLTPALGERILQHYAEANGRLADDLGMDLWTYGYGGTDRTAFSTPDS